MAMAQAIGTMRPETVLGDRVPLIDAAQMLSMHYQSVRRLIITGVMPATKAFGVWMIQRVHVEMFQANYDPRPGKKPEVMLL